MQRNAVCTVDPTFMVKVAAGKRNESLSGRQIAAFDFNGCLDPFNGLPS